ASAVYCGWRPAPGWREHPRRKAGRGKGMAMNLLRGASAILTFVVALLALALGLYGLVAAWAFAAQTHQPIDPWWLTGGLLACVVGVLCLIASRAIDPEHGPVRS